MCPGQPPEIPVSSDLDHHSFITSCFFDVGPPRKADAESLSWDGADSRSSTTDPWLGLHLVSLVSVPPPEPSRQP